jgi:hypothetical protein
MSPPTTGDSETAAALGLMRGYADRTGLISRLETENRLERRYLWTDAFAVCNLGALWGRLKERSHLGLALDLIERVHRVLGRHRAEDQRQGWLSGLSDEKARHHPTRGGLRIGKPLPERTVGEDLDASREWQRDGQYFHYLTKWMHALDQVAGWTRQPQLNLWARELAETAHSTFTYHAGADNRPRMFWKMSIDLSRPLVASMGHHDPLDGFVTCVQLRSSASALSSVAKGPSLRDATLDFSRMLEGQSLVTRDALGIGGLLADAYRVHQLPEHEAPTKSALRRQLLAAALQGLSDYARQGELRWPASQRLAFRELGLAIGLSAVELMASSVADAGAQGDDDSVRLGELLAALRLRSELGVEIRSFWLDPAHRRSATWSEHEDINEVMLATSLLPEGYLVIPSMSLGQRVREVAS